MASENTRDTTWLWVVGITILIVLLGAFFSNDDSSGEPDDFSLKYVGRDRLKAQLRDPESLEIIEERLIRPGRNGGKVGYFAKYRAKNGFGGYVVNEFYTE